MKNKTIFKRVAAMMMAGAMMTSMFSMNAFAADVTFTKTLDMSNAVGASVPDVSFSYTVVPGNGAAATDTSPEIKAGVGTPAIADVVYANTGTAAQLVQTATVDFSNVVFTEPGIYRYVITENAADNPDITNDANAVRYLDVYVVNGENGGFTVDSYVLLTSAGEPDRDSVYNPDIKSNGYTNSYQTYKLSLDKVVAGTMGDKNKAFDFTIAFEGPANASFTFGDALVTLDEDGKAAVNTSLKNGDNKEITGIPSTVKYTITENLDAKEGYTTENRINDGSVIAGTTTNEQTMGKMNNAVVFTNTKNATTPTGLVMDIAPYLLMVAAAIVLAVVFFRRRNCTER